MLVERTSLREISLLVLTIRIIDADDRTEVHSFWGSRKKVKSPLNRRALGKADSGPYFYSVIVTNFTSAKSNR